MEKKVPKIAKEPILSKTAKISDEPAKYKELQVSWQIGLIDFETEWGYWAFEEQLIRNKYKH